MTHCLCCYLERWPQRVPFVNCFWYIFILFHFLHLDLLYIVLFWTTFCLVKIPKQLIRFLEISGLPYYHREQKAGYRVWKSAKLSKKSMSKVTLDFILGHLSRKQTVARQLCMKIYMVTRRILSLWDFIVVGQAVSIEAIQCACLDSLRLSIQGSKYC